METKILAKDQKKGLGLGDMSSMAIMLVVTVIVVSFGITIVANVQSSQTVNSAAYNASGQGITGLTTFASNIPTLAIVIVGAIVIGILATAFVLTRE